MDQRRSTEQLSLVARAVLALGVFWTTVAGAQVEPVEPILIESREVLSFDRPEAWAMKFFSSLTLMNGFGTPEPERPGSVALTAELAHVPSLSVEQRRVGFLGSKVEDLNRTDIFGRVSVTVGLPKQLALTAGLTPPLEMDGVRPEIVTLSIGRPLHESRGWRVGARIHGHAGTVEGDLVCPKAIAGLADSTANPDGCLEPSRDEMRQRALGLELTLSRIGKDAVWEPHLAVSASYLDLEFAIQARYSVFLDRAILVTDGYVYSVAAGVKRRVSGDLDFLAEAFYAPLDVIRDVSAGSADDQLVTARFALRFGVR